MLCDTNNILWNIPHIQSQLDTSTITQLMRRVKLA